MSSLFRLKVCQAGTAPSPLKYFLTNPEKLFLFKYHISLSLSLSYYLSHSLLLAILRSKLLFFKIILDGRAAASTFVPGWNLARTHSRCFSLLRQEVGLWLEEMPYGRIFFDVSWNMLRAVKSSLACLGTLRMISALPDGVLECTCSSLEGDQSSSNKSVTVFRTHICYSP